MMDKRILREWLEMKGYVWVGDKHPTHPIQRPYTMHFTEEEVNREIESLEKDGYITKEK